jgi:hypothetical protein
MAVLLLSVAGLSLGVRAMRAVPMRSIRTISRVGSSGGTGTGNGGYFTLKSLFARIGLEAAEKEVSKAHELQSSALVCYYSHLYCADRSR